MTLLPETIRAAKRTEGITYAVRDIVTLAHEVAKTGREMLYLNIGDPNPFDFETPPHLIEAVLKAMRENRNGYSPSSGIPCAVKAVREESERNGIRNIQDIFITSGGSEAIEVCLAALVDRGDNVLIPYPGYPLYEAVLAKLEARPQPYLLDEADGWQPDIADMRRRIDEKTRAIVLINPNNPTGAVYTEKTLRSVLDLARERNLLIFADEIYDQLILDAGKKHISIASLDPEAPVITFNGLSKGYIAPGWRIGWGVVSGNVELLRPYVAGINKLLRARLCANHPMQYAVAAALNGPKDFQKAALDKLRRRRDITHRMLNGAGISCVRPEAAFYAFPKLDIDMPDAEFVQGLIKATGVVAVHGSGFGQKPGTKHLRVVYLPQEPVLEKAYGKLLAYLAQNAR
ncbi:MAG: aminotransferase class I/II-fold pyridoxal phosphate-dependent enzyme [Elusimicrobiota bacterium]|jgi:alanine-synthesizing transaminase